MTAEQLHFAARLADLPDAGVRGVTVNKTNILLVRHGNDVMALDGDCPHAGAPLAEGIVCDGQIVCPWHKAVFHLKDGKSTEPPAVDDLRDYPVEIRHGDIFVNLSERLVVPSAGSAAPHDMRRFVVLGAGAAGFSAATTLRVEGFEGEIVLISREGELPYDRTILSKYVLAGVESGEKSPLQDEAFYRDHRIERRKAEIAELHTKDRRILLGDGTSLSYDTALLATGGKPKPIAVPGHEQNNIFLLRAKSSADRIVTAAKKGGKAVIVGASFIGMEVAGSLRERGLDVTVIAKEKYPFEKQLGRKIGSLFLRLHQKKGVKLLMERQIDRFDGNGTVTGVVLSDGETVPADLVVIGLGVSPVTGFIKDLGLEQDGSLAVDNRLKAAEGLYAAGDVASFPLYGKISGTRIEHWRLAEQQGRVAAANMLGKDVVFNKTPYFWTIHYMERLDYIGHASGEDEVMVKGSLEARNFTAYYLDGHAVKAVAGMGRDSEMACTLAIFHENTDWTIDELRHRVAADLARQHAL